MTTTTVILSANERISTNLPCSCLQNRFCTCNLIKLVDFDRLRYNNLNYLMHWPCIHIHKTRLQIYFERILNKFVYIEQWASPAAYLYFLRKFSYVQHLPLLFIIKENKNVNWTKAKMSNRLNSCIKWILLFLIFWRFNKKKNRK